MSLLFDPYESIALFLSGLSSSHPGTAQYSLMIVLTVNYVVQDGKSNWLEGMILMCKTLGQTC